MSDRMLGKMSEYMSKHVLKCHGGDHSKEKKLEGGVKDKDQGEDDDNEDTHAESHSDACENSQKKHGPSRSINGVNE